MASQSKRTDVVIKEGTGPKEAPPKVEVSRKPPGASLSKKT